MTGLPRIELSGPGIAEALALQPGDTACDGWIFDRAIPYHEGGLQIRVADATNPRICFHIHVRPRDEALPAWKRSVHLDLIHQFPAGADHSALLSAAEQVVARLEQADGANTVIVDAPVTHESPEPKAQGPAPLPIPESWRAETPHPFDFERRWCINTLPPLFSS